MGGGLGFLHKKGFHTGSMHNQEIVWKKEQQKMAEECQFTGNLAVACEVERFSERLLVVTAKLDEIRKQVAEERQVMELQDTAVGTDGKKKRKEQKLSWLYEVPMAGAADQEAYLLGDKEAEVQSGPGEVSAQAISWVNQAPECRGYLLTDCL